MEMNQLYLLPGLLLLLGSTNANIEWIEHTGKASSSTLIKSMHETNVDACKEWCSTADNCAGFGWKPVWKNCWFAKTSSDPTADLLNDNAEVNFYEKIENIENIENIETVLCPTESGFEATCVQYEYSSDGNDWYIQVGGGPDFMDQFCLGATNNMVSVMEARCIWVYSEEECYEQFLSNGCLDATDAADRTAEGVVGDAPGILYISGLHVTYTWGDANVPQGHLAEDINKGFGGAYVWLEPIYTDNADEAASGFHFWHQSTKDEDYDDLAKGAGGDWRYIKSLHDGEGKVTGVHLTEDNTKYEHCTEDLNRKRGGRYLYLCWDLFI